MAPIDGAALVDAGAPVGVVGAGTMGAGIAQLAATAGHAVLFHDAAAGAIDAGLERIAASLERAVARGRLAEDVPATVLARIRPCPSLDALAPAALVIEAIVEDLVAKQQLLQALETFVQPEALLASNSSSLSITALGALLLHPERLVGMHFFNPAPAMPLVEVVRGLASTEAAIDTAMATARAWGKTPVEARSTPGFIVNRVARPFYGEALRALSEGAADVATIDAVMAEAGGFAMGPFALIDLIGLDVNLAVSRQIHAACHGDPRYAPSPIQEEMVAAGRLGRKTGRGFLDHGEGVQQRSPTAAAPAAAPGSVVVEGELGIAEPLVERFAAAGIQVERTVGDGCLRLADVFLRPTDGRTATEHAWHRGAPVVLFDLALDYARCGRLAIAAADQTSEPQRAAAVGLLQAAGIAVSVIDDHPGLLVMRTVCMLANEAAEAVRLGVASAADVDLAMRLGVAYPRGPLAWADAIGLARVLATIDALAAGYGEDRYRASPLLRRRLWAGRPLHD
jgi:3-hydroxybutyryl-CoA dehydrogenase